MELNDTAEAIVARDCNLSGSQFEDVDMADATFRDATMQNASFSDIDLRNMKIHDANLENAEIRDCNLEGMTIEGIPVSSLLEAYEANRGQDFDEEDIEDDEDY